MKKDAGWWFPDHEEHLQGWMKQVHKKIDGRLVYQYGKYEAAKQYIKDFRYAVDIGGHVGLWAWFLAKDFESVLSFEPMPSHQECWEKNMEGVENAGLYRFALGESSGQVALETRTPDSSGDTQIIPGKKGEIEMRTLDSFGVQNIDLIKIDCEGYEEFVLRGAEDTLERCKPVVIVEQKHDFSCRYGLNPQSAVGFLEDRGAKLRNVISGDYILSWD